MQNDMFSNMNIIKNNENKSQNVQNNFNLKQYIDCENMGMNMNTNK